MGLFGDVFLPAVPPLVPTVDGIMSLDDFDFAPIEEDPETVCKMGWDAIDLSEDAIDFLGGSSALLKFFVARFLIL